MGNILVVCQLSSASRWEAELLSRLQGAGHAVSTRRVSSPTSVPAGLNSVLALEGLRFGSSLASPSIPLPPIDLGPPDLVIDLTGTAPADGIPMLALEFCGQNGFAAGAAAMLASRQLPDIIARLDGVAVSRARPMLGDRVWLSRMGDDMLAGAGSLVLQCVARFFAGRLKPIDVDLPPRRSDTGFIGRYVARLGSGLAGRLMRKLKPGQRPFYWQVAYRLIDGPGIAETGRLDGPAFSVLPDDGERFYADPFVIEDRGRHFLFVEEFPYERGRGVISVAELGDDGTFGRPGIVIEEPHHLSYPQVFAQDGEIFMIPESSAAREVVLYRALQFPDRWVREAVLIHGRDFNDATLLASGGRFWLLGTERFGHGSASDTMTVYSSDDLRGPWEPHRLNPITIDRSAARPGGAFIHRDGRVILPVQDGTEAYGGGLGLMDLVRLDEDDVVFAPPRPIGPGDAWMRAGIHTLNRVGRLEVIDSAG